jgi:hypothetical protein
MATYTDLIAIRSSGDFIQRATAAIENYAKYILGSTPATPLVNNLVKGNWAKNAAANPDAVFDQLSAYFIQDALIAGLANGTLTTTSLTDANFDSIVQTAINNTVLTW